MQHRTALILLALAGLSAFAAGARAETTARVLAMHPAGDFVTLATNETFYVRIAYTTDEPVTIWARPYYQGVQVRAGSNSSRDYTGSGEALGWFFLMEPGQRVDEIRITAGGGQPYRSQVVATQRVHIESGNLSAAATQEPGWVAALRSENERLLREEREKQASTPPSVGETLQIGVLSLVVIGALLVARKLTGAPA